MPNLNRLFKQDNELDPLLFACNRRTKLIQRSLEMEVRHRLAFVIELRHYSAQIRQKRVARSPAIGQKANEVCAPLDSVSANKFRNQGSRVPVDERD